MKGAVFIILVGPGDRERRRLYDLLATLLFFEAEFVSASTLLLVNDRNEGLDEKDVAVRFKFDRVIALQNPYARETGGDLVYDRLTAGVWEAFARAIDLDEPQFVLKADTDALVCGPFAARLQRYFAEHPSSGMLGSLLHNPDGTPRNTEDWWGRWLRSTCGLLPHQWLRIVARQPQRLKWGVEWQRWRARHTLLKRALRSGWRCGENILGGAYAVAPAALRRMRTNRSLWQDNFMFNGTRVSEDVALSMLIAALEMPLEEFNRAGEVFAVWYQKPTLSMAEIVRSGYGFVHSIKDPSEEVERGMRSEIAGLTGIPMEFRSRTDSFQVKS